MRPYVAGAKCTLQYDSGGVVSAALETHACQVNNARDVRFLLSDDAIWGGDDCSGAFLWASCHQRHLGRPMGVLVRFVTIS